MFERSMIESQGRVASAEQRWTAMASVTLQVALAGLAVALPLLHPEGLTVLSAGPKMLLPPVKLPEVRPVRSAAAAVQAVEQRNPFVAPISIPPKIGKIIEEAAPAVPVLTGPGMGERMPAGVSAADTPVRAVTVVAARPERPVAVSGGVAAGMLLAPIRPVYPALARAARQEGTVVMEAVISKAGSIESLRVTSGPEMFRRAAMEAVQAARYQPYRLNGEATDVQTTITVNFRLGG
jgi:periplasmic protein TonB